MNYYDRPEISHSDLKLINKSLEHYYHKNEQKDTKALEIGRAFHSYVLENEKFNNEYIFKPEGMNFATKEGKAWKEENKNKAIITPDFSFAFACLNIFKHPLSNLLKAGGLVEQELFFNYLDVDCRAKLDYINLEDKYIVDLKTVADASKAENESKFNYASQAWFYKTACNVVYGGDFDFYLCFVEKSIPYGIKWITFNSETLDYGFQFCERNLTKWKNRDKEFSGYSKGLIYV